MMMFFSWGENGDGDAEKWWVGLKRNGCEASKFQMTNFKKSCIRIWMGDIHASRKFVNFFLAMLCSGENVSSQQGYLRLRWGNKSRVAFSDNLLKRASVDWFGLISLPTWTSVSCGCLFTFGETGRESSRSSLILPYSRKFGNRSAKKNFVEFNSLDHHWPPFSPSTHVPPHP